MLLGAFYWLLSMSILGSLAGLVLLGLRRIRRLPRGMIYGLWLVPAFRLTIPAAFVSPLSLMAWVPGFPGRSVGFSFGKSGGLLDDLAFRNMVEEANSYFPMEFRAERLEEIFWLASLVWAVVAAAAIFLLLCFYAANKSDFYRLKKRRWTGKEAEAAGTTPVFFTRQASSAAVYGMIRPQILLPERLSKRYLPYIVRHELVHVRRRDNLWRCVALFICCIHWFNPLIWIFLKYFLADMELACDSRVLRGMTKEEQKEYALAVADGGYSGGLFAASFGGAKRRERIECILSYRRLTLAAFCVCFLLALAVTAALATNAAV